MIALARCGGHELLRSDCRHYCNALVYHSTGEDNVCGKGIRELQRLQQREFWALNAFIRLGQSIGDASALDRLDQLGAVTSTIAVGVFSAKTCSVLPVLSKMNPALIHSSAVVATAAALVWNHTIANKRPVAHGCGANFAEILGHSSICKEDRNPGLSVATAYATTFSNKAAQGYGAGARGMRGVTVPGCGGSRIVTVGFNKNETN
ncbi:hypothetical protein CYMTET_11531 [Cymbomonas tetramitiformis]|uniref:Uncharacterized protein n=1 Tax=Cymbomonas tetramitiformis TaxID=36881 RepID=A0AAE0LCX5_9CHLO|nr:hypothetical protein CYMTET_11531 [Cymbomonas tetramitiformis]